MLGKIQMFVILSVLVIGSSAATLSLSNEKPERVAESENTYAIKVVEVEALFDHEVHLILGSESGEAVWGTVKVVQDQKGLEEKRMERDFEGENCFKEEEEKERCCEEEKREEENCEEERKDHEDDKESREEKEDPEEHEEAEEREEEEERDKRGEEEEREEEREHEEDEERERDEEREEDEHHEREYKERKREQEEQKERFKRRGKIFRFHFKEGKGDLLLFPSSHRALDLVAYVTVHGTKEPIIEPYIHVKDTETDVYIDDVDDEGNRYCRIKKDRGVAWFGFEDLKGEDWNDWDYNDVILNINRVREPKPQKRDVKVYVMKVRWGQLDGHNEEHEEMVEWDGFVTVNGGRIKTIKPILFEYDGEYRHGCDDELLRTREPNTIEWRSSTTVHWDGICVVIVVPSEQEEPAVVGLSTSQWSKRFSTEDLGDLYIREKVNRLGDEIEISGCELCFEKDVDKEVEDKGF